MGILVSNEILDAIYSELSAAQKSVQLISAFCKLDALKKMEAHINPVVSDKRILVRFRLLDIVSGATDFDILNYCMSRGWKVHIRFDLHAKTYIVDNSRGITGSANMTSSGLDMNGAGNYEMASFVKIEQSDIQKIKNLFDNSIAVTEKIIKTLKEQYELAKNNMMINKNLEWSSEIKNLVITKVKTLFSYDLPDSENVNFRSGDRIDFLDFITDGNIETVKNVFMSSNCYKWLFNILVENNGSIFFGELTQKLHDSIVEDPKPYRKDVKQMLSNLLIWIQKLKIDNIIIDRPNHSQRIRLK